jgi:cyanate permease
MEEPNYVGQVHDVRRRVDLMPAPPPQMRQLIDESSPGYVGWRVVAACFIVAVFAWGFGLYGHAVYLAELHRLHGWSTALISGAASAYYLLSATLVVFISDAVARLGPKRMMLFGACLLGTAMMLLAFVAAPWQLYAVYLLLAVGVVALHTGAISNVVGLWFDQRRGLAISLALSGASFGGILVTPLLVLAIEKVGFSAAMMAASVLMAATVLPAVAGWIDRPVAVASAPVQRPRDNAAAAWSRRAALRSLAFWSVAGPFALALMAQIGFFVHQIAFLEPFIGRTSAGLAVGVMAIMGIAGRLVLGFLNLRLDMRVFTAVSVLSQAAALFLMTLTANPVALFIACGVFGLSIGNLITLPALVIEREFEPASFGMLVGLSTAIGQFTCVVGPSLLGFVRDLTGGYTAALAFCIALEIVAAAVILVRPSVSATPPTSDTYRPG